LLLHDEKAAQALFQSMLRQWGDSDVNHVFIGRAYSQAGYDKEAAAEFHKAMELNPHLRGVHYQLGLSYLREDEAAGYDKAIPEFRAELALYPDDFPSHYMLGYIAEKQNRWDEAEKQLRQASEIQPKDLESLIALGDVYVATKRPQAAEAVLRQALAVAGNQTSGEIVRAHYLLGRILLSEPGHQDEAKHELGLVAEMQKHSGTVLTADARAAGAGSLLRQEAFSENEPVTSMPAGPASHEADDLRASIADAYNNLGAIAGNGKDFSTAASDFRRARQWNPALPGVDHNLGMALFYSGQFHEAAAPLRAYVDSNPDDVAARGALGFTLFRIEDYAGVVAALKPIQDQMNQTPKLAFVYAASLARTGAYEEAIEKLKGLESANPNSSEIHLELSRAYEKTGKAEEAAREMKLYQDLKK
jgi:tetratricopeptide (TPR) repeat protein